MLLSEGSGMAPIKSFVAWEAAELARERLKPVVSADFVAKANVNLMRVVLDILGLAEVHLWLPTLPRLSRRHKRGGGVEADPGWWGVADGQPRLGLLKRVLRGGEIFACGGRCETDGRFQ
eukprot:scaffold162756_cov28-Tisochrysis_lutea.AAC.1